MTVQMIQQHFRDLAALLRSSKAATAAGEIEQIADGLAPFNEMPLAGFAGFLVRAEEFARTGQVATTGTRSRTSTPRAASAAKPPKIDVSAVIAGLKACDDQASRGELKLDELNRWLTSAATLSRAQLVIVTENLAIRIGGSDAKTKIVDKIRQSIEQRHGFKIRSKLIHPPTATAQDEMEMPITESEGENFQHN